MFGAFSQIIVAGKLSRDPEMRYTPSGQAVTTLSIPVNRVWNDNSGERQKEVTWHNITIWGKQAELANQHLRKGSVALIVGRLQPDKNTGGPRIWTKQSGEPGASYEITAKEVTFLVTDANGNESQYTGQVLPDEIPIDEDDIPF
jgi:single-strand DNA-binding protein